MVQLTFQNGDVFPSIGLGTWLSKPEEVYNAVLEAIRCGYRHIDCAYIYKNEKEVGDALKFAFDSGFVTREEMFITSKLWNNFHAMADVEKAIKISLKNLQLDYLDLYLIHWPLAFKTEQPKSAKDLISLGEIPLEVTWKGLEKLKKNQLTRHIGVSNFNIPKLKSLIQNSGLIPEVLQVELHPYMQQDELVNFCQDKNILLTAYSPLGSRHLLESENSITENEEIKRIAQKHNCTVAQVILAWGMERGTSVIPKSVKPERIKENYASKKVKLDEDDMRIIKSLNKNLRNARGMFAVFPGGEYTYESIWLR